MRITFTAKFQGGRGTLTVKIKKAGEVLHILEWDKTGTKWRDLSPGFYMISATGNASPNGTEFKIFHETKPETPTLFTAGPIAKGYTLTLN